MSLLRPQEIPRYVQDGFFDLGITGRDWVEETASDVDALASLEYAKSGTGQVVRIVLAVPASQPWNSAAELPDGARISTEYPELTRRFFERLGKPVADLRVLRRDRGQGARHRRRDRRRHRDRAERFAPTA